MQGIRWRSYLLSIFVCLLSRLIRIMSSFSVKMLICFEMNRSHYEGQHDDPVRQQWRWWQTTKTYKHDSFDGGSIDSRLKMFLISYFQ